MTGPVPRRVPARVLALVLAALVFHLLLIQPNHPDALTWRALVLFPLELPCILLGLMALPRGRGSRAVRVVLVAGLLLSSVLKLADFALYSAYGRGFNPVADLMLIGAGIRLSLGATGPALTALALLGGAIVFGAVTAALWWASGVWAGLVLPQKWRRGAVAAACLSAVVIVADAGHVMGQWHLPRAMPGSAFTTRLAAERIVKARDTLADLRSFRKAAADDPFSRGHGLLGDLDRDVMVIFVESYGRASFDTSQYGPTHRATLSAAEERLHDLGLSMRSGFLKSPTRGGQSWLSHATLANGLWIDNQTSYRAMLSSGRRTLFHIASEAGFRTAAVMPQITLDWPEAELMGFDRVLAARDLGYAGLPFNWVTMPDQYTYAALDRQLRSGGDTRRLFVQVATGSSHAPWTPVPDLVPWDAIGDGRVFNEMARSGATPQEVWSDRDRVRDHYRRSIDYALRAAFDYIARQADSPPLVLLLGDHQAAGFVALDERPDVPVHLIGPAALVAAAAEWGWQEGLVPDANAPVLPMDRMRDLFIRAYSSAPVAEAGG
ncbi:sulfatase [Pseudooceanicola sp. C21-150M6]|uniref:sulfatase n=1 Tax=Pseudooceanicola sp. C21-150M6 TaxID=3434355 RepID=UPI003D7FC71F